VASARGMLSVELAKVEDGWLWHSGMTGSILGVGFGCYDRLVAENVKGRMGNISVVRSSLHDLIDFSGRGLV
jgi:hypothetical protein